ncbi:hypothetical protein BRC93_09735 [Halobacteriales archaeon QS_5_70_15]|nr:MAG: hypothetical protein BRC93_09735 [Halobacteriales archaeon QS_5_70_15]
MTEDGKRPASRGFGTRCVHAGAERDPATGAAATPIHQTTSYEFEDADTAADLYALDEIDHVYSRISNPTVRVLERRLAALHDAPDALATGSGMAAFDAATTVLAESGDNVVSAASIYGGTSEGACPGGYPSPGWSVPPIGE